MTRARTSPVDAGRRSERDAGTPPKAPGPGLSDLSFAPDPGLGEALS